MKQLAKSIDHINIVVEDLELVSKFFLSFGFQIVDRSRLQGDWISETVGLEKVEAYYLKLTLPGDTTSLELLQFEHPRATPSTQPGSANTVGFRHLAFRVQDIVAEVAALRALGIETLSGIQEYQPTQKKLVYFKGPEDILLELAQYG